MTGEDAAPGTGVVPGEAEGTAGTDELAGEGTPGSGASSGGGRPPTNRMVIAVLSLVGIFVCGYLALHSFGVVGSLVCTVGSCEAVQASRYAWVGPVPVSLIGVGGYVLLLGLSLLGLQPGFVGSRWVAALLAGGAAFGLVYSAYLTWLEAFVIHAWCQWCVISAILVVMISVAAIPEVGRARSTDRIGGG